MAGVRPNVRPRPVPPPAAPVANAGPPVAAVAAAGPPVGAAAGGQQQQHQQQQQQPQQQPPAAVADGTLALPQQLLDEIKKAYDVQRYKGSGTIKMQWGAYKEAGGDINTRPEWVAQEYTGATKERNANLQRLDDGISPRCAFFGFSDNVAAERRERRLQSRRRDESVAEYNAFIRRGFF